MCCESEKTIGLKFLVSSRQIRDSYIYVRVESENQTEENRRFSRFFAFFDETFQVSPCLSALTAPYRAVRTSNRRSPTCGGLDAPPLAGRHTRLSFKALALAVQGMLYVAVSYSILRIEDCNCYRIGPWRSGVRRPYHAILKGFLWYRESVSSISYLR